MDITFIRGNTLQFSTQFFNPTGNPITPDTAVLTIRTATLGVPSEDVSIDMTESGGVWTATWDTSPVAQGTIFWAVKATNPAAVDQGCFDLTANQANV